MCMTDIIVSRMFDMLFSHITFSSGALAINYKYSLIYCSGLWHISLQDFTVSASKYQVIKKKKWKKTHKHKPKQKKPHNTWNIWNISKAIQCVSWFH